MLRIVCPSIKSGSGGFVIPDYRYRKFFGNAREVWLVYRDERRTIVKVGKRLKVLPTPLIFFDPKKLVEAFLDGGCRLQD